MAKPKPSKFTPSFELFLSILKPIEGGYQNDIEDDGNRISTGEYVGTNRGISARLYESIIGRPPTVEDMKAITQEEANAIYKQQFWDATHASKINSQAIANILVDHHINSGKGVRMLQQLLNNEFGYDLVVDNVMGPDTLEAINSVDPKKLTNSYVESRKKHYDRIIERDPKKKKYEKGWKERAEKHKYKSNEEYLTVSPKDSPEVAEAKKTALAKNERIAELIEKDKEINTIDENFLPEGESKESMRREVLKEISRLDGKDAYDEYRKEKSDKISAFKKLLGLMANGETTMFDNPGEDDDALKNIKTPWGSVEEMEAIKEALPEDVSKYLYVKKENGKGRLIAYRQKTGPGQGYERKSLEKFIGALNKQGTELFGEDFKPLKNQTLKEDLQKEEGFGATMSKVWNAFTTDFSNTLKQLNGKTPVIPGQISGSDVSSVRVPGEQSDVDWEDIDQEIAREDKANEKKPTPELDGEIESEFVDEASSDAEGSEEEVNSYVDQFLDREKGLLSATKPDGMSYDKSNYKKEIPFDAVTGLALGLIGNDQAKNADIPLRTEDVGQAIKAYTSELARRAADGLPPEVEAAINNKLAEAYQGGLETLKNASGGNRATVLGNLGQLETAKNRGLVDAQLADYEAKERAFQQYGQAIQYIDQVRMNRDVANTSLRQQMGMQERADGQQLAAAGFQKMIEGIKYQKENGPGSANHMYKSAIMQKLFGFDPNMKDNGEGDTPGTRSYFEKERAAWEMESGERDKLNERWALLPQETKDIINSQFQSGQSVDRLKGLMSQYEVATDMNSDTSAQTPALATNPLNPESQPEEQQASFGQDVLNNIGFGAKTLIKDAKPTKVAPAVDIESLARNVTSFAQGPNQIALAGGANNAAQMPTFEAPKSPQFPNANPVEMPTFESSLAQSVQNQKNYYDNQ